MSSVGFSELLILFVIGLIVLGPERLPRVASQIGNWIGQARRMTRTMKRQLEDEINFDPELKIQPPALGIPRDDDTYSPLHDEPKKTVAGGSVEVKTPAPDDKTPASAETPVSMSNEPETAATEPAADLTNQPENGTRKDAQEDLGKDTQKDRQKDLHKDNEQRTG